MSKKKHPAHFVGASNDQRPSGDFYPTSPGATLALLNAYADFPGSVWEPACGDGAITKVLQSRGFTVYSSDLYDRGYGKTGVDFFRQSKPPEEELQSLITNPPYRINRGGVTTSVEHWIDHAWNMPQIRRMAFLMKTTALAGGVRSRVLERCNLAWVLQFRNRLTFHKDGIAPEDANSGMIDMAWFIFERGYWDFPKVRWIDEVKIDHPQAMRLL